MQTVQEITQVIKDAGWIGVTGFGIFLFYKFAVVSVVSYSLIKTINKVVDALVTSHNKREETKF